MRERERDLNSKAVDSNVAYSSSSSLRVFLLSFFFLWIANFKGIYENQMFSIGVAAWEEEEEAKL